MGEANIRFARGEREEAILMCMEIIRQGMGEWANFWALRIGVKFLCAGGGFSVASLKMKINGTSKVRV